MKDDMPNNLSTNLKVIIKYRKFIIRNTILIAFVAVIISILISNKYTATALILPPNPNQDIIFGLLPTSSSGGASGFSSLAKLGGLVSGVATPSELYAAIMRSGTIKSDIINKYDLKKVFKTKTMYHTNKKLEDMTNITISPEGIISVSVTYKNKMLAADIANAYVTLLDKFNTESAMTVGKRYRIFIERRFKDAEVSLGAAEDTMRQFQEKNHTIALDIEIKNAIETFARIKSEIILREVQKGAWSSVSQIDNPYITNIQRELNELEKQLSNIEFGKNDKSNKGFGAGFSVPFNKLPAVAQEYARLFRNVKVQEAIYELLTQQFEQAKIMEVKDTPTVQFLDRASPPEKKSSPRRTLIVLFSIILSVFLNLPVVFFLEYLQKVKSSTQDHQTFNLFLETISQDYSWVVKFIKKNKK